MGFSLLLGGLGAGVGYGVGGTATAAALGFGIGSSIGGGIDRQNVYEQNAQNVYATAQYNAAHTIAVGQYNAAVVGATAATNAALGMMGAVMGAQATTMVATYNAGLKTRIADYNASLLEDEAELVWQAAELDVYQFRKAAEVMEGSARAAYGASGVLIDLPEDTPSQVLLDMETERELEVFIMRHNADIQAGKLLAAAAHTRWEGQQYAQQIMFEGFTNANLMLAGSQIEAIGGLTQAAMRQNQIQWTSQLEANRILTEGYYGSLNYTNSANQALVDGFLGAGNFFANYLIATAKPTKPTTGTTTPPPAGTGSKVSSPAAYRGSFGPGSSLLI